VRKRHGRRGEPELPEDGWYGFGEDAIWALDFTEGGAPYGPTRAELREASERMHSGPPWARAKSILSLAMSTLAPANSKIDVGRVIRLGDGLSRIALGAAVEVSPDPSGLSGAYVVLLPGRDATPDIDIRARQEMRLLHRLSKYELPFRIPRVLGAWPESGHRVVVRSFLEGVELDLRAGRQGRVQPWEVVAQLASAIHQIDASDFADLLPGHATCQAAWTLFRSSKASMLPKPGTPWRGPSATFRPRRPRRFFMATSSGRTSSSRQASPPPHRLGVRQPGRSGL